MMRCPIGDRGTSIVKCFKSARIAGVDVITISKSTFEQWINSNVDPMIRSVLVDAWKKKTPFFGVRLEVTDNG